ncbi:MAG: hypothetical protein NTV50_07620 [Planctomycetota bacterium]|nr:hypothetical protein [Planctomycetota bacterium]
MNNIFEHPWLLLGLFPMVFVVMALYRTQQKLAVSLALWVPSKSLRPISLIWFIRQNFFLMGGMLLLVLAAAGPLLPNQKASGFETRHGLVVIALKANEKSTQSSINLQSRLLSQIQKEHFLREGGRIGLMPYGGGNDIFCPLTLDPEFYDYVASSLKRVSRESAKSDILDEGVSLDEALKSAFETMQNQTLNSKQMVIVLFENSGNEESIRDALIHANIPADIGLTLVFPEALKVPEIFSAYCKSQKVQALALGSKVMPEGRVMDVLKKGNSRNGFLQDTKLVYAAAPAWFALPGLLCLLLAFMFPPKVSGLVRQLANQGDK